MLFSIFFRVPVIIFGLVWLLISAGMYSQQNSSHSWLVTQGTIVKSEITKNKKGFYCPSVHTEYITGDMKYTTKRISYKGLSCRSSQIKIQETLGEYPVGKIVDVYWDPNEPDTAVLSPGVNYLTIIAMLLGGVASIGLAFIPRKKQSVEQLSEKPDFNSENKMYVEDAEPINIEDQTKVYSPAQVACGALIGGPVGLIYFLMSNFDNLGKEQAKNQTLNWGALGIVALIITMPFLPDWFPSFPFTIAYILIARFVAEKHQLNKEDIIASAEYRFYSNWNVFGMGLLCLIGTVLVLGVPVFLLSLLGLV